MRCLIALLAFIAIAVAKGCKSTGCKSGQCCSYWGYCGSTVDYCGSGKYQCVCDCKGKKPCKGSSSSTSNKSSTSKTNTNKTSNKSKNTSSHQIRYVDVYALNIRKGPGTNYGTAGVFKKCQKISITTISNGWAKLSNGNYVSAQYLSKTNPCGPNRIIGKKCKLNINKAVQTLVSRAHSSSTGYCAKYVETALQAGGLPYGWCDAYACVDYLLNNGFVVVSRNSPAATKVKGDIAIFDRTSRHPYGHMVMWSGSQWISDFVQYSMSPYRDWVPYRIFRYIC